MPNSAAKKKPLIPGDRRVIEDTTQLLWSISPGKVKFKPVKSRKGDDVPKGIRIGRTYDDFLLYAEQEHIERHTEHDSV